MPRSRTFPALFLLWFLASNSVFAAPGLAFVTSVGGGTECVRNGKQTRLKLHETLEQTPFELRTGAAGNATLVFSNGVALSIGSDASVRIHNFSQEPFSADRESFELEPSASALELELLAGALALATGEMRARSKLSVITDKGSLRIHSGRFALDAEPDALHIVCYEGSQTFTHAGTAQRRFLVSGEAIHLVPSDTPDVDSTLQGAAAEAPASLERMTRVAGFAQRRVFFRATEARRADRPGARPVLFVDPEFFAQEPARPFAPIQ